MTLGFIFLSRVKFEGGHISAYDLSVDYIFLFLCSLQTSFAHTGSHCAVAAILLSPQQENLLTTVTKQGVIVQWDLEQLSVQSFAANATPVSLRRVVLSESLPLAFSAVLGATFVRRGYNFRSGAESGVSSSNRSNYTTSVVGGAGGAGCSLDSTLCLTLTGGCVLIFDMAEQKLLESIECPLFATATPSSSTSSSSSAALTASLGAGGGGGGGSGTSSSAPTAMGIEGDGNITLEAPPALHCPINFSRITGNQLFYVGAPKSNHLDIMRLGGSTASLCDLPRDHLYRQQLKILQQQHLRYADAVSYLEHLRPGGVTNVSGKGTEQVRYLSQQLATMCLSSKPLMQRCTRVRHTLQGRVLEATPGSTRIEVSQDLTAYLCGTGLENRSGAAVVEVKDEGESDGEEAFGGGVVEAQSSRSMVSISGMLNGNKSSVLHLKTGTGTVDTVCYTIDAIYGCEISLDKPYRGPPITAGIPSTSLHTNLQPKPPPSAFAPASTSCPPPAHALIRSLRSGSVQVNHPQQEPSGKCGERLAHISLPSRATAIQPHPHCPYVVVGCLDDSVVVLSAESSIGMVGRN